MNAKEITALLREVSGQISQDWGYLADKLEDVAASLEASPACPHVSVGPLVAERPRVVCLCGSTRFHTTFQRANYQETMEGRIVLSVGFYPHAQKAHKASEGCTDEQKIALDALHFRKIEMADEVLVLDVGGYIGESTRNEIAHATKLGKPIRYWSQEHPGGLEAAENKEASREG